MPGNSDRQALICALPHRTARAISIYRHVAPADVRLYLKRWITSALRSRIPAFIDLAGQIRHNYEQIIAAVELDLSNARLEGINSRIRLIQRRGYGYRRFDSLAATIYLCIAASPSPCLTISPAFRPEATPQRRFLTAHRLAPQRESRPARTAVPKGREAALTPDGGAWHQQITHPKQTNHTHQPAAFPPTGTLGGEAHVFASHGTARQGARTSNLLICCTSTYSMQTECLLMSSQPSAEQLTYPYATGSQQEQTSR